MPRPLSEWQDEIAANLLEDLEEITGVSIGEMMADEIPESGDYETFPVYEEPLEGEDLDLDSDAGDTDDYFDDLFSDLDIDYAAEEDQYGDD